MMIEEVCARGFYGLGRRMTPHQKYTNCLVKSWTPRRIMTLVTWPSEMQDQVDVLRMEGAL